MAKLEGQKIADSYEQLLHTDRDGGGNGTTLVNIKDGKNDNTFALQLATDKAQINGVLTIDANATDGTALTIDSEAQDGQGIYMDVSQQTSGYGIIINDVGTSRTTGGILYINSSQNNSGTRNLVEIKNVHTGATGTTALKIQQDSTAPALVALGNVGIGVTPEISNSAVSVLQVGGNGYLLSTTNQAASGEMDFGYNFYYAPDGNYKYIVTDEASMIRQGGGNIRFRTAPSGSADATATFTERMVVTQAGNIGIGTATPSSFDSEANNLVVGNGSGDNGITIFTGSSAGNHGSIFFGDATGTPKQGQIRYEQNNEVMSFHTNTTERMRIDLNGNVAIATGNLSIGASKGSTATDTQISIYGGEGKSAILELLADNSDDTADYGRIIRDESGNMKFDRHSGSAWTSDLILDVNSRISLSNNDSGTQNTVFGHSAGANIDAGSNYNVFIGHNVAGGSLSDATENVGLGYSALANLTTGDHNTAIGRSAGLSLNTGANNTIIGSLSDPSGATGTNQTVIGYNATGQADNSVVLGNASVTDVYMGQSSQANINAGQLTISDTAVDSAANYIGLSNIHTKTAGSSDTSDSFTGLKSYLTFNDADAAFGNMLGADIQAINTTNATGGNSDNIFGLSSRARQDAGNSNNVFGGAFYADLNDGNLDQSAYGLYVDVDVEAPCEVAGDVFGIYVNVDDDDASAGECYGIRVNCASNVDAAIDLVGGGIKFPATQASSSNANTLDDYEEGVFDVTATTGSGSLTVNSSVNSCAYTKIGRVVHVQGLISFSAISSPSGDVYLDGLPFVNASGLGEGAPYQAGSVYMTGANTAVNNLVCFVDEATNYLYIREGGTTGTGNDVANHIDTGTSIFFQITYQIPA